MKVAMTTAWLKIVLVTTLAGGAAFAQNSDLAILTGAEVLYGRQVILSGATEEGISVRLGTQLNYARQVVDAKAGGLYVEFPLIYNVNSVGNANITFTPGVRFKLATQSRLSPYFAAGVGVTSSGGTAFLSRSTSAAVDFGAGLDIRLTRLLSLRTELRDYVARRGLGGYQGRNHPIYSLGIAFHF
jgi:hypothetical protein